MFRARLALYAALFPVFGLPIPAAEAQEPAMAQTCIACHEGQTRGFGPAHAFGAHQCSVCHEGDPAAANKTGAHAGLVAYPGGLADAPDTCGRCHAQRVADVLRSAMHTGVGMVDVTRQVVGQETKASGGSLQALGDSPADSMLRKLCAGCHLGQPKTKHALDPIRDRGGGCLACHINAYPENGHPALTARVRDERCFGCHARSSRISLNYPGLAEVDDEALTRARADDLGRLADGRLVERKPSDIHHRAGMGCIDCHTGPGLMGGVDGAGVDIQCSDCHDNRSARPGMGDWPAGVPQRWIPYEISDDQVFLTTARSGVPLWHVEVRGDGYYLHPKLGGRPIPVPRLSADAHRETVHGRLSCDACHAQWAPQCHGCHLRFEAQGRQWDHVKRELTPGKWVQRRWLVRNDLPPLGVRADRRIGPFIPGMILTVSHPEWDAPRFRRFFGAISPHTTGPSRSCASCHNSSVAVGLGTGRLKRDGTGWTHTGLHPELEDGLPADAWTGLGPAPPGRATRPGDRAFSREEIRSILDAGLNLDVQGEERKDAE